MSSRRHDYEPRLFMDSRKYRSLTHSSGYHETPQLALVSARTAPIVVERRDRDYFSLDRDDPYHSSYAVRSPLDRAIYDNPSVLTNAEHIRTRNIQVQLANATITSDTPFAELHPKLTPRGRYPMYFREPILVGKLAEMDNLRLERVQLEYEIPILGSKRMQICALVEYLGAVRLGRLLRGKTAAAVRR